MTLAVSGTDPLLQQDVVQSKLLAALQIRRRDGLDGPVGEYAEISRGLIEFARVDVDQIPSLRSLRRVTMSVVGPLDGDNDVIVGALGLGFGVALDGAEQHKFFAEVNSV